MVVVIFLPGGLMEGVMKILKIKHSPNVTSIGKSGQRDIIGEGAIAEQAPAQPETKAVSATRIKQVQ
jgi:branched-chain amino acid transport system permease protein